MLSKKECFYNLTKTTTTKKQEEAEKLSPRHFFLSRKPSKFKYNFIIWYRIVFFYPSRKRTSDLSFTKKKKIYFKVFKFTCIKFTSVFLYSLPIHQQKSSLDLFCCLLPHHYLFMTEIRVSLISLIQKPESVYLGSHPLLFRQWSPGQTERSSISTSLSITRCNCINKVPDT